MAVAMTGAGLAAVPAQAAGWYAPPATAKIHPGVMMYTGGAQCTANFVYTDSSGNIYVGYAAHYAGVGEATDANTCAYNDLALVQMDGADTGEVNPSVPFFGGPVAVSTTGTQVADKVYSYGNSSLRAGLEPLSPKFGLSLGDQAADDGWSHPVYTMTPAFRATPVAASSTRTRTRSASCRPSPWSPGRRPSSRCSRAR